MSFKFLSVILFASLSVCAKAQLTETYEHKGEYGASIGVAHYFGDLNPNAAINKPKFSGGIFYKRQLNNYIGIKASGNYSLLGYSDAYSKDSAQRIRNLSFNSNVWEVSLSGDFNFFKFYPELPEYRFTPYVSLGIGVMHFDPYTYIDGTKVFLRDLGTEGQGRTDYPDRKKYSKYALIVPIGFGFKYNITNEINLFGELTYRFTSTDYLDDVSTTYVTPDVGNFKSNQINQLSDRSGVYGYTHAPGQQRGNSTQKDAYATLQIGISVNIQDYKCPF
ncbi:DUF6089 family protein [Parasediminibacterium sp. JCM 36343]|uniref:type IX secretion system protein PorG n=1 Tax=Parasediminibacterium sp. JCM 36343 TaxID=3374279 RepID=UPI003977F62B